MEKLVKCLYLRRLASISILHPVVLCCILLQHSSGSLVYASRTSGHTHIRHHDVMETLKLTAVDTNEGAWGDASTCLYEGRVQTKREWFGYLANVTVAQSGRIAYELTYPVERCCASLLFYLEDQVSLMTSKMNCWQKESLLPPETDQVLRLTPRFPWSGCHVTHPHGLATYSCVGARSLSPMMTPLTDKTTTWSLAISNCASLAGLELTYRIVVEGHIGECRGGVRPTPAVALNEPLHPFMPKTGQVMSQKYVRSESKSLTEPKLTTCIIEGKTSERHSQWHGFFLNVSLRADSTLRYEFAYPSQLQVQSIIFYDAHDLDIYSESLDCLEREQIIPFEKWPDKMLRLRYPPLISSSSSGGHRRIATSAASAAAAGGNGFTNECSLRNATTLPTSSAHRRDAAGNDNGGSSFQVFCKGEKYYHHPRRYYLALSNCQGHSGLMLEYRLELTNVDPQSCPTSAAVGQPHLSSSCQRITLLLAFYFIINAWQQTDN